WSLFKILCTVPPKYNISQSLGGLSKLFIGFIILASSSRINKCFAYIAATKEYENWSDEYCRKEVAEQFEKLIFSSYWQMHTFLEQYDLPMDRCEVQKTAIFPFEHYEKPRDGKINLIYASTPQRGLHVLCNALHELERDDWHLHVYSSFQIYGWKENDQPYGELFEHIENNPNMTLHKIVRGRPLREEWKDMHIWAYPCIWEETSCRTAMEAMSSRTAMLTNSLGALPETCSDHAFMYPYIKDEIEHCYRFADEIDKLMDTYWDDETQDVIDRAKKHADKYYSWDYRAPKWIEMFELMDIEDELEEQSDAERVATVLWKKDLQHPPLIYYMQAIL
ncbi:MAG: glycosyltransferase, partial [Mycoplasmataceae bacterium]|nr:glycosyltransferase [Mycoplasmataceae bacterium]